MDNKPKRKIRKKRTDTANDRYLKETNNFEEAEQLNLWRSERKLADELMQAIRTSLSSWID